MSFPHRSSVAGALSFLLISCGGGGTAPDNGFNPSTNTTISGNVTYPSVNIPAGVTVTVSADAVITVTGNYTQAGSLTAPCHALTLLVDGTVTVTGPISNECTDPAADGTPLRIVGKTAYSFTGSETVSSGDISIVNDPTRGLTTSPPRVPSSLRAPGEPRPDATSYRCKVVNRTTGASPLTRKKAADGHPTGEPGTLGATKNLDCGYSSIGTHGGSMLLDGATVVAGSGGEGGDGITSQPDPIEALGGVGARPGGLNITADDDIDMRGQVTLTGGNGGDGGRGIAGPGAAGNPGVSVKARGGKGGDLKPKNFDSPVIIQAGGAISQTGRLTITLGHAGNGGAATATGGPGIEGNPGKRGGNSTANGGNGGNTFPVILTAVGAVSLNGTVDPVAGGAAGAGGAANHIPGAGGPPDRPGAGGGPAGFAFGFGGNGGAVVPLLRAGVPDAKLTYNPPGGAGGNATYTGAKGGDGAVLCPNGSGGPGGKGGDASGGGGDRSTGTPNGAVATVTIDNFGNGGAGKMGTGPGGLGGANGVTLGSGATGGVPATNSFMKGTDGGPCPASFTMGINPSSETVNRGGTVSTQVTLDRTGGYQGAVGLVVKDAAGVTRGSGTIPPTNSLGDLFASVPLDAPLGANTWDVTGSGSGVDDVHKPFALTINPVPQPAQVALDLPGTNPPLIPGPVDPRTYLVRLVDAATQAVVGTMNLIAEGPPGNTFYGNPPPRVGWSNLGAWVADLSSAIVNGVPYAFRSWQVCILNTVVDAANPVNIKELDKNGAVVATTKVISLAPCTDITLNPATTKIRHEGTGKGTSADAKDMKGKNLLPD